MALLFVSFASVITVIRRIRFFLEDGYDESSFLCLRHFFFLSSFFFFDLKSDEDVFDDDSDNDGSGSGFTRESGLYGSCTFLFSKISFYRIC